MRFPRSFCLLVPTCFVVPTLTVACVATGVTAPAYVASAYVAPAYVAPDGLRSPDEAATAPAEVSSLPPVPTCADLVRAALRASPGLLGADAVADAAAGRAWQSELWPNPTLRVEARDVPTNRFSRGARRGVGSADSRVDNGRGEEWVTLVLPVSVSGRRGAAQRASRAELSAAVNGREAARRDVVAAVATAWAEVVFAQEQQSFAQAFADASERSAEIAAARVRDGTLAQTAALGAQREVEIARVAASRAGRELEVRLAALGSVVAVPKGTRLGGVAVGAVSSVELGSRDAVVGLALGGNPTLEAARDRVDAAARRVDEAVAGRVPDVDLMLAAGRNAVDGTGFFEGGIAFPLPVFNRNQGAIREARANLVAAQRELEGMARQLDAELVGDWAVYLSARDGAAAWRGRIVPLAEAAYGAATSAFSQGTRSEDELLVAQKVYLDAQVERSKADRELRLAEIEVRRHLPQGMGAGEDVK